jgi:hypothetical protein
MAWLVQERIFVEENNLETILPTNFGLIFFIHPRALLNQVHMTQQTSHLPGPNIPAFNIQPWKAKAREYESRVYLIQTIKSEADTVNKKFEYRRKLSPYEYISWKSWTDLNTDKTASLIDQHNTFLKGFRRLTLVVVNCSRKNFQKSIQSSTSKLTRGLWPIISLES